MIFKGADILIPQGIEMEKWSVVACDQFTSEPEYWAETEKTVGDSPSTLNITFPEIYLKEGDARIEKINKTMQEYIDKNIFKEYKDAMILVRRYLPSGVRTGIVGAVDLDEYSYEKDANSQIRATEGTVTERIPPRVKIRENAPLELPHVLLLMNDIEKKVIEPLKFDESQKLYDFRLMQNGGRIEGFLLSEEQKQSVIKAIDEIGNGITFAVGDGNHSLATAKECWRRIKETLPESERENNPARFALCEIENIHDPSLVFEPIHRILLDYEKNDVLKKFKKGEQKIEIVTDGKKEPLFIEKGVAAGVVQEVLDTCSGEVDYIHGEDVVLKLSHGKTIGFLLPPMDKSELFDWVLKKGPLPRKTFSMGEANEKRYYLEARRIK